MATNLEGCLADMRGQLCRQLSQDQPLTQLTVTRTYTVRTRHPSSGKRFMVPVQITATSPREAAQKRLRRLSNPANCNGLLVEDRQRGVELFEVLAVPAKYDVVPV